MIRLTISIITVFYFNNYSNAQFGSGNSSPKIDADKIIIYKETNTTDLRLWVFNPEKMTTSNPAIIFFYGGGWRGGSPTQFQQQANYFLKKGFISILADYRVQRRDSTTPVEAVMDAKSAIRWIRKNSKILGVDSNKIVASGGSAGGYLAASTATVTYFNEISDDLSISSKPNAMILFNPVIWISKSNDLQNYLYELLGENIDRLSPYKLLDKSVMPTIIFHGYDDETVSYKAVEQYDKKMKKLGIFSELHLYKREGHGFFNYGRKSNIAFKDTMEKSYNFLKKIKFVK